MSEQRTIQVFPKTRDDGVGLFASELDGAAPERPAVAEPAAAPQASAPQAAAADITRRVARTRRPPAETTPAMSVADVLRREVSVAWYEAVAIVIEAGEVSAAGTGAVPALGGVLLAADGSVRFAKARSSDGAVQALGRMLHELLAKASGVPAGLRLLATAAADAYPSVPDFTQALTYFGRPDRRGLICAVYERALAAPAPPEEDATSDTPPAAPEPFPRRRRELPSWVPIAAACACVLSAIVVLGWMMLGGADRVSVGSDAAPSEAAAGTSGSDPDRTIRGSGSDRSPARAAAATRSPTAGAEARPTRAAAPAMRRMASAAEPPISGIHVAAPWTPAALGEPPPSAANESSEPPVTAPTETVIVDIAKSVYSSADHDVRPPLLTYPQLQPSALPEIPSPIVNTLELLVGEDGSVERVQMLSRPRRMSDMMILSGIKMWRFRPASKGGRPVRYRTVLNWTVTP